MVETILAGLGRDAELSGPSFISSRSAATRGFAHVIFRDNLVFYTEEMKPEDMAQLFGFKRLMHTEVAI